MPNIPKTLKRNLQLVVAIFTAIGAVAVGVSRGSPFIEKFLVGIGVPPFLAVSLSWMLPIVCAAGIFVMGWRASRLRSRLVDPDRFELKVRAPQDLKGRQEDITDFVELIETQSIVFLVGESGAGKSTLVEAGVIP